jgi:hypothetical protein
LVGPGVIEATKAKRVNGNQDDMDDSATGMGCHYRSGCRPDLEDLI